MYTGTPHPSPPPPPSTQKGRNSTKCGLKGGRTFKRGSRKHRRISVKQTCKKNFSKKVVTVQGHTGTISVYTCTKNSGNKNFKKQTNYVTSTLAAFAWAVVNKTSNKSGKEKNAMLTNNTAQQKLAFGVGVWAVTSTLLLLQLPHFPPLTFVGVFLAHSTC